ncbi:TetR/AcrR family transcriptional regulator [Phytohabitans flavus]|uniref:TetR family transcriptional regulator n=1 Tax=Phytohabitans flavus TaxID=1076124 RepID=A0A6F8XWE6_9ACTN|nr:TetR family transcriptional regulator [Phytohabitans flavus]
MDYRTRVARTKGFDPDVAVDQAMELFWANGYANTTPQQLVEALGIGRGSLYNAFTSKHNLYELALRRYHDRVTTRFIEVLDQPGPARERIRSALELIVTAVHEDQQRRGCMIANAAVEFAGTDEAVNRLVRRALHRQEAALRSAIEEGQRAGEVDADRDAAQLAAFLLATINGVRVVAKADPDPQRLTGLVDTAMLLL